MWISDGVLGELIKEDNMKVLIACEESQEVCKAFRKLGHKAYSCDVQKPSGGHPEWHILGDALKALNGGIITTMDGKSHRIGKWDPLIAHPPCTYLSNAGARHLWKGHQLQADRVMLGIQARDFLCSSGLQIFQGLPLRIQYQVGYSSCQNTHR